MGASEAEAREAIQVAQWQEELKKLVTSLEKSDSMRHQVLATLDQMTGVYPSDIGVHPAYGEHHDEYIAQALALQRVFPSVKDGDGGYSSGFSNKRLAQLASLWAKIRSIPTPLPKTASTHVANVKYTDLSIPGVEPDTSIEIRIYHPTIEASEGPVVLWAHGGGFVMGDRSKGENACTLLASTIPGASVVTYSYRLGPEHRYPAPQKDTTTVFNWIRDSFKSRFEDAPELTGIIPIGISTGATLTANLCRERGGPPPDGKAEILGTVMIVPVLDATFEDTTEWEAFAREPGMNQAKMDWFWKCHIRTNKDRSLPSLSLRCMTEEERKKYPPAYMLLADCDPLSGDARRLMGLLESSGRQVSSFTMEGVPHASITLDHILEKARSGMVWMVKAAATAAGMTEKDVSQITHDSLYPAYPQSDQMTAIEV